MSADTSLMETLLRIEHKLDILLSKHELHPDPLTNIDPSITKLGSINHKCPVCKSLVTYDIDINDPIVIRKCGCSTGKIALDMKAFAPPVSPARKTDNGGRDEQEERNDSDSTSRRSSWR